MGGDKAWECSGRLEPGADPLASTFPGEDLAGIQLPEPPRDWSCPQGRRPQSRLPSQWGGGGRGTRKHSGF